MVRVPASSAFSSNLADYGTYYSFPCHGSVSISASGDYHFRNLFGQSIPGRWNLFQPSVCIPDYLGMGPDKTRADGTALVFDHLSADCFLHPPAIPYWDGSLNVGYNYGNMDALYHDDFRKRF